MSLAVAWAIVGVFLLVALVLALLDVRWRGRAEAELEAIMALYRTIGEQK